MKVYIAWYHDGFYDNPSVKLGVFAKECAADEAVKDHKRTRDRSSEYKDRASWEVEECEVKDPDTGAWKQVDLCYEDGCIDEEESK